MRNQIVILAAGQGKRMGSGDIPKVLIMLNQKPLILHLLEEIEKINQLAKPVVVVGYKHFAVRAVLGDGFLYAVQDNQLGTAHAVMSAKSQVSAENILVLYGDMPFIRAESLQSLMRLHHEKNSHLSMFTTTVNNYADYPSANTFGRIIRDEAGSLIKITEYKDATESERFIREVNPGIYMFNTEWLWNTIPKIHNKNFQEEYYLTDMVEMAIQDGKPIYSLPISPEEVLGINTPEELALAEKILQK